jgi:multicomponent Na+:H+ antiporter subunit D
VNDALPLQIVVPLLAAPLCLILRNGRLAGLVALLVTSFTFGNAVMLLERVRSFGPISYSIGDVPMPLGIEYRLDLLNAFVLVVIAGIGAVATLHALLAPAEIDTPRRDLFFACWLLSITGLMGITVTGDAFNVFVFLEIASLSGYVLVAHGGERKSLVAAFRYLMMGTVGGTMVLIAIGLLYMATGTLNMADIAARLPGVAESRTVGAAFAFLTVGLCFKAAVFPLHLWLPAAYGSAPNAVTALLAGTATKVALYLWIRFFFTIFGPTASLASLPFDLLPLGLIGAFAGSLVAVFQKEPKRLLAWSSIGQVGYMIIGIRLGTEAGLTAAVSHLFNHAIIKAGIFLALGCVALRLGASRRTLTFDDLVGLGKRMPLTAAAIVTFGFGLIGMPLTAGFVSKWLLVEGLLAEGQGFAVAVVLLSSLFSVVYVWRLVEAMYFGTRKGDDPPLEPVSPLVAIPMWILALATLYFGVETSFNVGIAGEAVQQLLGVVGAAR